MKLNFDYADFSSQGSENKSLRNKIPVVEMMVKMYKNYVELRDKEEEDPDPLEIEIRVDPVLRFVRYVLINSNPSDFTSQPEEIQLGIIRYITAAFYSVKGTAAVFSGLTKYLGLEFADSVVYTQQSLDFKLTSESVSWVNEEERFVKHFNDFLFELLFIGKGGILDNIDTYGIDAIEMTISDEVAINTGIHTDLYRYHIAINEN